MRCSPPVLVSLDKSYVVRVVTQLRIPIDVSDVLAVETVHVARLEYLIDLSYRPVLVGWQSQSQQVSLPMPGFSHYRRLRVVQQSLFLVLQRRAVPQIHHCVCTVYPHVYHLKTRNDKCTV